MAWSEYGSPKLLTQFYFTNIKFQVSFGISGACVPLIEIITQNLEMEYFILAVIVMSVSMLLVFGPDPEKSGRIQVQFVS